MSSIVIISPAHPLRGGIASFSERLAMAFQEQGDEVTVYTFCLQYPRFLFPGKTQYSTDPAPAALDIRIKINSLNPFNWWKQGHVICKARPDLVIIAYWLPFMAPCLGTLARLIRQNRYTRIIGLVHNLLPHEKRVGDLSLSKYFLNSCDVFITLSREVLQQIKKLTPKKASYAPHPIYDSFGERVEKKVARQILGLSDKGKYLLFFGIVRPYKGLDLLLPALADERVKAMQVQLLIAGEFYESRLKYDKMISELGLQDRVRVMDDFIPAEQVKYYFGACDAVVQTYRNATQSGISQMAYHFEKPLIVTNVGGLAEIVPDGKAGIVVAPDSASIAAGILRFYQQNEEEFAQQIKIEKQKYSWTNFVKAIEALLS